MAAIIGSPTRYIQGKGEMKNLCSYADKFGKNLFILTSASGRKRVEPAINEGNKDSNLVYDVFNGECCMTEINRIIKIVEEAGSDVIIGIGGGKIHDTSKAVAYYTKKPVIIVPTIASTDAPCSALSVIYTDEGVFEKYLFLPSSPDMVIVDTDIVCKAPVRLLISGMGDALATYFEARACKRSDASNCVGGKCTLAAMNLAQLCYDTLMENGVQAMIAAKEGICTKAVENVIEANLRACKASSEVAGEAFNIAYGGREYLIDVYYSLCKALGKDTKPIFGSDREGDIKHSNADISKAKEMIGYEPSWSFEKGITAAIEWYRENL